MNINQNELRTVVIATHCPNNTLESFYVNSLSESIRLFLLNNIRLIPLFINDVSSSVVAKNELLSIISKTQYESVVFIDHDITWDANSLLNIVNSSYDAVALPVVKKTSNGVTFDLEIGPNGIEKDIEGYIKVNRASTAMFKLSNKLVTELCDMSLSITNPTGNEVKNVFESLNQFGKFFNESSILCNKIRGLKYPIWLNPETTCGHISSAVYAIDFLSSLNPQSDAINAEVTSLYQ